MRDPAVPRDYIGPNAIIQSVAALRARLGAAAADRALAEWGHSSLVDTLPTGMIPEADFNRLVRSIHAGLGPVVGAEILDQAGQLTGDYLLANRIPRLARRLLPLLPPALSLRLLGRAIGAHAWTFAGSGSFLIESGGQPAFSITGCPMCRDRRSGFPSCSFYRGTFERLLQVLVRPATQVTEVECEAAGGRRCRFLLAVR